VLQRNKKRFVEMLQAAPGSYRTACRSAIAPDRSPYRMNPVSPETFTWQLLNSCAKTTPATGLEAQKKGRPQAA